ncbi:MAG: GNAT family N-acetyltransferase [Nitrospirota bacterium]|nr:GNAT family N-acetyltransferase [Nitrospirota bacterium]
MRLLILEPSVYEDKKTLLKFIEKTAAWSDYNPPTWNGWLMDASSRLIAAEVMGQYAAIAHVTFVSTDELWLQGLRVAPSYRGQGIAVEIVKQAIEISKSLGASVIRYATRNTSKAIERIGRKLGFRTVAIFTLNWAPSTQRLSSKLSIPFSEDIEALWTLLKESNVYRTVNGLYSTNWKFHSLTINKLYTHLENGEILILKKGEEAKAIAIWTLAHQGRQRVIGYVDGAIDSIGEMALALRTHFKNHLQEINVTLPNLEYISSAFLSAGYRPYYNETFSIYEQNLKYD